MKTIAQRIAEELSVSEHQVQAAISLLDNDATVPFIARYRKEVTGGLDDTQLRTLEERLYYLRELDERREVILNAIREQEKLTPELETAILAADTKTRLEDLYLPYKPKRRTKAQIAREAGLEPLALELLQNPNQVPAELAAKYLNVEQQIEESKQALDGARQILMEKFAEEAELLGKLREYRWQNAQLVAKVVNGKAEKGQKFSDYFDHHEPLKEIPSHRALALFRGRKEGILNLTIATPEELESQSPDNTSEETGTRPSYEESQIAAYFQIENQQRPADEWLLETVRWAWRFKIRAHLEAELLTQLREYAETEAIKVFAKNLHDLLLAAPAGPRATIGLDPGIRTGVKVAVIDKTGKLLETTTIYPHRPKKQWKESLEVLAQLAEKHQIELISIGNGTASRETDKLVMELIQQYPQLKLQKLVVSEAGASVYSASKLAAEEFPDLEAALRGAVSIARRLQDPLAELVKIEPKSIGVGQYQHDVNKSQLARTLEAVVEDCVNAVGVDVNTASVALLTHVSGLNAGLARNIVEFRDQHGAFLNRELLKQVPRLGEKTFEQAAGFLRIMNGDNPLDASAVHPEAYPIVERIVAQTQRQVQSLIGDRDFLQTIEPEPYVDDTFGLPTITDILRELEKPGRDPRPEFKTAVFKEGIEKLEDLEADMILEGVVTNVTNFGAFIDIGVHQDGLVHISAMSHDYVKNPHDVVKAGDIVKVKVLEIDLKRRRIALTMRLEEKQSIAAKKNDPVSANSAEKNSSKRQGKKTGASEKSNQGNKSNKNNNNNPGKKRDKNNKGYNKPNTQSDQQAPVGIMAEAFARARKLAQQ